MLFSGHTNRSSTKPAETERFAGKTGILLQADDKAQYAIERMVGQGGFADVYLVKHRRTQQFYALKLLRMWDIQAADRKEVLSRFAREYECSRIDSPYLIHSYCQGNHLGNPFFIMDYCPNGSLRQRIGKNLPAEQAVRIAIEMLVGLSALHKQGIIHRDLKPENVLFSQNDTSLLTDFGISGFLKSRMTIRNWLGHVKSLVGTLVYMPPEQLDASKAYMSMGPVTDIFAFGVLLFEMLTGGHVPFGDDADASEQEYVERVRRGQWINLEKYRNEIPESLHVILENCLRPDFSNRYQSTDEILGLLGNRAAPPPPAARTTETLLRVMNGDQHDRLYNLSVLMQQLQKRLFTVGWFDMTHPKVNDIEIVEEFTSYISRFHATIEYSATQQQWYIRDGQWLKKNGAFAWHKSTNGLLVNSARADASGHPLANGDIITLGDTTIRFETG